MTDGGRESERRLSRKAALVAGAVGAAGTGVGLGIALGTRTEKPKLSTQMTAAYRRGALPLESPTDRVWGDAKPIRVALSPQQIATPFLHEAGIESLTARALHNGRELAFLLEWEDDSKDDLDGIGRFRDAVAVQLPARAGSTTPITMGAPGSPVHILQWRATWQRDVDGAERTGLDELYPRAVRDLTPEELLGPEGAVPYYAGRAARNPLSAAARISPVEEIIAEGFGSVTNLAEQRARGAGVFGRAGWEVVVGLPMDRRPAGAQLEPGSVWPVAFALWLGSRGNRGSRKHFANWVRCELEAA